MAIDVYRMIDDNGDTLAWYAKGNYTFDEVVKGVEFENGDDYFDDFEKDKLKVEHIYLRCVPVSKYDNMPFSYYFLNSKKGRGAFEVSIIYVN